MHSRPVYFDPRELVDPETYESRGERALELMDSRVLLTADALRRRYGPIIVNNWSVGGPRRHSGLRSPRTTIGARFSQHKYGRALDCLFRDVTEREVYDDILLDPAQFPYITTLENIEKTTEKRSGEGWLHFDCRWHEQPGIWIVNP